MPTKLQLGTILAFAVMGALGAFLVQVVFMEEPFPVWSNGVDKFIYGLSQLFAAAVSTAAIAIFLFHIGLWRLCPYWLAPKPDLNGTWRVVARRWNENGDNGKQFLGYMFVKQNYFSISMRLETVDTASELEADQFTVSKGGLYQFWAIYHCEARALLAPETITAHYGAFVLTYESDPEQLSGRFWIDGPVVSASGKRFRGGQLLMRDRKKKNYHNFEAAHQAYGRHTVNPQPDNSIIQQDGQFTINSKPDDKGANL